MIAQYNSSMKQCDSSMKEHDSIMKKHSSMKIMTAVWRSTAVSTAWQQYDNDWQSMESTRSSLLNTDVCRRHLFTASRSTCPPLPSWLLSVTRFLFLSFFCVALLLMFRGNRFPLAKVVTIGIWNNWFQEQTAKHTCRSRKVAYSGEGERRRRKRQINQQKRLFFFLYHGRVRYSSPCECFCLVGLWDVGGELTTVSLTC